MATLRKKKFDFKAIGMRVAGVAAGAVAGKVINKPLSEMDSKLRGGLKIVIGAALPEFIKHKFVEDMGSGLIAIGAGELIEAVAPDLVSGIGSGHDLAIGDLDLEDDGFVMDADVVLENEDVEVSGFDMAIGDDNAPY